MGRLGRTTCLSIGCCKINSMSWLTLVHSWVFASLFLQLLQHVGFGWIVLALQEFSAALSAFQSFIMSLVYFHAFYPSSGLVGRIRIGWWCGN